MDNSSHAVGTKSDFGGIRQRQMMGRGEGTMKGGDFGVGETPGTRMKKGEAIPTGTLSEKERANPGPVDRGTRMMREQAKDDHGPHIYDRKAWEPTERE